MALPALQLPVKGKQNPAEDTCQFRNDDRKIPKQRIEVEDDVACDDALEKKVRPKITSAAVWASTFVAVTGLWQYGFSIGSINAAYIPITNSIRRHYEVRWQTNVSSNFVEALYVTASAMFPVGGMFGSLLAQPLVQKLGRLHGLLLGHIVVIMLSILIGLTDVMASTEVLIICRFGFGLMSGAIATGISMMYLIEVSPRHLRGLFGTVSSIQIAVGITASNVLGLPKVLGSDNLWPALCALTGLPSVFFILFFHTLPESPRELYIDKGKKEKAEKILKKLNGTEDVGHILQELEEEKNFNPESQLTIKRVVTSIPMRSTLIAALVVSAAMQLTGVNGVYMNFNNIFLLAGVGTDKVHYATIGVVSSAIPIQFVVTYLVEKYGRKILLVVGYLLEGFFLVLLTICMETQKLNSSMAYVSIVASFGFIFAFGIGPGPVTLTIVAEFFDQTSRPGGMAVSVVALWLGFALTTIAMPYMLNSMGGYSFLVFAVLSFLSAAFIKLKVPETKNRPFTEIQKKFRPEETGRPKLDTDHSGSKL